MNNCTNCEYINDSMEFENDKILYTCNLKKIKYMDLFYARKMCCNQHTITFEEKTKKIMNLEVL